jgi:hypothetical protein
MITQSHAFRHAPSWTFEADAAALATGMTTDFRAYRMVRFGRSITRPAASSPRYLPAFRRTLQGLNAAICHQPYLRRKL